jgi:hypothetical protein
MNLGLRLHRLSYSEFLSRVRAGEASTAVIDSSGGVTGTLEGGERYTTQIPTALQDTELASELQATITGQAEGGTTLLDVILSFLPFVLLVGVWLWTGRHTQRQLSGGSAGSSGRGRRSTTPTSRPRSRGSIPAEGTLANSFIVKIRHLSSITLPAPRLTWVTVKVWEGDEDANACDGGVGQDNTLRLRWR